MNEHQSTQNTDLVDERDQPLIGLIMEKHGHKVVRYFADESQADAALADSDPRAALATIGAFADLDWDELRDVGTNCYHVQSS